ncbi:uncharacterized protein BXIN_1052 [Babesia sp. Xinjiang]|uniref:uncharacterized protein n=1 Tax=Babesia sp. Xinjiang TaxID=462227 RepID=UPI000A22ACAD|nr:uncharacterized protein BXIN_1052 [Babesia sp. Xinjiang]ORM41994.1 hypothetical protein BXIN_1052 [Babesia sp. Xinjiang]
MKLYSLVHRHVFKFNAKGAGGWTTTVLSRRGHHAAAIKEAYELSRQGDVSFETSAALVTERLSHVRGSTLSTQEAFYTLQLCLKFGYFYRDLLRDCLAVVEADFFSPALTDAWNGEPPLITESNSDVPTNCYHGVNAMSIRDKAAMIVWQDKLSSRRKKHRSAVASNKFKGTSELDPERREVFTTKKLGKVLDPKPLKVRVQTMVPGKKLCGTLALQLREAISCGSLADVCDICAMFSVKRPLSGKLNDDTIELLTNRLCEFTEEDLCTHIHHIAILCAAAAARTVETWSHHRASEGLRSLEAHRLYRISRKQLSQKFLKKLSSAVGLYSEGRIQPAALGALTVEKLDLLNQHINTLRLLARSDLPLSMSTWDRLMALVAKYLDYGCVPDVRTAIWLLEAIIAAKYTTPTTVDVTRRVLASCKPEENLVSECRNVSPIETAQIIRYLWTYSLAKDARLPIIALLGADQSRLASFSSHIRADIDHLLSDMRCHLTPELAIHFEHSEV